MDINGGKTKVMVVGKDRDEREEVKFGESSIGYFRGNV